MARPKSKQAKELADREKLTRAWRKWHGEQLAEALVGLHRDVMGRLVAKLKALRSARELVEFVNAQDWSAIDANTRMIALHEVNAAITRLRERAGQEPIDDALPGQPLRAFQLVRAIIDPPSFPHQRGGPPERLPGKKYRSEI